MSEFQQNREDAVRYHLKKTVVMVGMMGAGKTAVGRALAARLSVPFLDSDAEIEAAANMTVPEIFARDGEPFFRQKEAQVIARLLDEERGVLSTGGGAFLQDENRKMISARGVSLWLNADLDLLWQRVRHKDTRPLLRTADPRATLAEIFAQRAPVYALADVSVRSAPDLSIEAMVDRVIETLALARPDVLEVNHA
ncbi:shikimate kinase [uncultured Tateyamaria sp.]|uniref:shikimate kinase n=1 Tax=Tateyamaria sp. 1078 TaxID=3417464 RepID=UPI00260DFE45|nr:shikimate kinase [uncultured Tateyamaria sp.]